ncbi:hypothetical protein LCGC14_1028340 [marine sediment metagenome]|uniref:SAM-dependent chlorinase/fluorinase n=1 Tax=marine sediment metagenome TaxID=412755 RepID=A0A0F9NH42_9ZZZZ
MLITFLSDFGTKDEWVSSCKGIIKSIAEQSEIIDITHDIESFNVVVGAMILSRASSNYKPCVHLAIVDPGVGTRRDPIAIETETGHIFVGPDNGLLTLAAENFGIKNVVKITNEKVFNKPVSTTFHARDIFAPAAAYLSLGKPLSYLGEVRDKNTIKTLAISFASFKQKVLEAQVIEVDKFGSLRLNIQKEEFQRYIKPAQSVHLKSKYFETSAPYVEAFGDIKAGEIGLIIDSSDLATIFVNRANASTKLGLKTGSKITVAF